MVIIHDSDVVYITGPRAFQGLPRTMEDLEELKSKGVGAMATWTATSGVFEMGIGDQSD